MLEVLVSSRACAWSLDLSWWGLGRSFAATVSTVSGRWRATGALVAALPAQLPAALPAVLWVAAHDSRPASFPANVACNSPNTAPHHATISLELQRLRTLLKVHSIELHAKLLRARAACAPPRALRSDGMRVGPLIRTWVRHLARGPSNPHVGPMARAWAALWRISRGLRACRGANAHVQRFMCERHTRPGAVASTTQTTSPTTPRCRRLLPRWFATWAPPRGATSPTASVGNCATRGPVRVLPADDCATKRGELHY